MKNMLKLMAVVMAGAAVILSGCSKDSTAPAPEQNIVELSFSAEKPELPDTRTVFENGSIFWNVTGESIRMAYTVDGTFSNKKFYQSNSANVSEDRKKATFTVSASFSDQTQGSYQFYALYPAAAASNSDINYAPSISVRVTETQTPANGSFDPNADVMLAKAVTTYTDIPTSAVPLRYTRMVAHGHVTLSALPLQKGEAVRSVVFTAPDGIAVAGLTYMDLVAQTHTDTPTPSAKLTLNYNDATLDDSGSFDAWFCSLPFTIAEGQPFTVDVTTGRGTYTRTITARTEGISFKVNSHNTLSVDMSSATFTPAEELGLSGDYVVLAPYSKAFYALSSTPNTSRLASVKLPYDGTDAITVDDETLVWTIVKSGSDYTLANGDKYLRWTSGNEASTGSSPYLLTLEKESDGTYLINSKATASRGLRLNTSGPFFAFYTSATTATMIGNMLLVPATYAQLPKIIVAQSTLSLGFDDTATNPISVTLKNITEDQLVLNCYEGSEGTTPAEWLTAAYNAGNIEITAQVNGQTERTARIVLSAATNPGPVTATITVTQGAAGQQGAWNLVPTLAELTAGTYYITALNKSKYYAVPNTTISAQTFTCIEGTLFGDDYTAGAGAGEFVFTAVEGVPNAFYIRNKTLDLYLAATGSKTFGYVDAQSPDYGYWTFSAVTSGGFSGQFSVQHAAKTHYMRAYNATVRCYDGASNQGVYLFKYY